MAHIKSVFSPLCLDNTRYFSGLYERCSPNESTSHRQGWKHSGQAGRNITLYCLSMRLRTYCFQAIVDLTNGIMRDTRVMHFPDPDFISKYNKQS